MSTNPFYRFEPANYNAGFEPAFSPTVDALNGLSVLIPAGYGIGSDVQPMINQIQGYIANLNVESKDFNFRLVYPSPFPVLSGANNLTFYIVNDQLRGANPSQVFTIFWQVTNATIVDAIITPNANVSFTADYSTHLYEPEAVAYRALRIANQNGSAFFPLTYQWNSTTGIASSGLARCNDCQFDLATGYPDRYPGSTLPTSPDWKIEFPALNSEEKYVYLLVEKIINKGFDPSFDYLDLIAYAESLILPSAEWSISTSSDITGFDRIIIEITSSEFSTGFVLVGRYDAKWQFQRFFNNQAGSLFTFLSEYSPSTQLPYEPNNFKAYLTGANTSYDIEQICFAEPCAAEQEFYAMPAKIGDQFQFNIIPESSNMIGVCSAKIGLMDCNDVFIQEIGSVHPVQRIDFGMGEMDFLDWVFEYCDGTSDLVFTATNENGDFQSLIYTIPSSEFVDITTIDDFIAFIATIPFPEWFSASVTSFGNSPTIRARWTFGFCNPPECFFGIQVVTVPTDVAWLENVSTQSYQPTQLQASVEIPAVIDGEYRFALYNQSETALEIYATSNPIRIDNAECFSEIIEFWGDGTVEGFEYYGDWKQRIRIGINGGGEKIQLEESLYRQSNGIHRRPSNKTDLSLDLHTDYLDLETIKAMTSATRHKFLIWKNQNIFVNGDIEVATTQDFTDESSFETLSQMKFQALVQGYQPYNNSCLSC